MLKNYLKIALKVLARRKVFTFISLFGISFTLLVLTIVTAMLDHTLAPMPPETHVDRLLSLTRVVMYGPNSSSGSAPGFRLLDHYARGLQGVERFSISTGSGSANSYIRGQKINSSLKRTDGEYWKILDFTFLEGAPYSEEDVQAARFVAVINAATRTRFFGDGSTAVGKTIEADGQRFQIVGVVPDVSAMRTLSAADIYVPLTTAKTDAYKQDIQGDAIGLILARTPADVPRITEEFNDRMRRFDFEGVRDRKFFEHIVAPFETPFDRLARLAPEPIGNRREPAAQGWRLRLTLAGLALLFMLLPAVNLINLNMSRIMERGSEIGVRKAFGASSRTLVAQFVIENVLLTVIGGLIGFVLSIGALRLLSTSGLVQYATFSLNTRVFVYGLGLAVLFGLISGVYPAWRMSRLHPIQALKGATR